MREIEVKIGARWRGQEEALMKRLAEIVVGNSQHAPFPKSSGYNWALDTGNDWWAKVHEETTLVIAYRYGDHSEAGMDGLAEFLEWRLG